MKILYSLLLLLLTGCAPGAYFFTSNDVVNTKATVLFNDSTKVTGTITIPFEQDAKLNLPAKNFIYLQPDGSTVKQEIPLPKINGYYIGDVFYALKKVDVNINTINHLLFVKRLTNPQSKIQLYTMHQSGKSNDAGDEQDSYFLSFPGSLAGETVNVRSVKLMPAFEAKMSGYVNDCPALADKIRAKEEGYFLPFFVLSNRKYEEVLMNIIKEYDACQPASK